MKDATAHSQQLGRRTSIGSFNRGAAQGAVAATPKILEELARQQGHIPFALHRGHRTLDQQDCGAPKTPTKEPQPNQVQPVHVAASVGYERRYIRHAYDERDGSALANEIEQQSFVKQVGKPLDTRPKLADRYLCVIIQARKTCIKHFVQGTHLFPEVPTVAVTNLQVLSLQAVVVEGKH